MTDTVSNRSHAPYAGLVVNLRTALRDSYSRHAAARRLRGELQQLTDRELADIGLVRSQIEDVVRGEIPSGTAAARHRS